ncbi:MAG: hypothetical protein U1F63_12065 [Chitinivorax sp.]
MDRVYALKDIDQLIPYLGKRQFCKAVERSRRMALDEGTGRYILNLPIVSRDDTLERYILVDNGEIILFWGGSGAYVILYVSPSLSGKLNELTPFLRKAFSEGGAYLTGRPMEHERGLNAEANFYFEA